MRRPRLLGTLARIVAFLLLTAIVLVGVYFAVGWPWLNRWGATDLEAFDVLPGDELVPANAFVTTLAVTVAAPPESIFPWLLQMGAGRAGLYTYPWLEAILGGPARAAGSIVPEWQELTEGQFVRLANRGLEAGASGGVWVRHLSPDRALVGCRGNRVAAEDSCAATWQWVLEPKSATETRLILRSRTAGTYGLRAVLGQLRQFPIALVERGILEGIRARAEALTAK